MHAAADALQAFLEVARVDVPGREIMREQEVNQTSLDLNTCGKEHDWNMGATETHIR